MALAGAFDGRDKRLLGRERSQINQARKTRSGKRARRKTQPAPEIEAVPKPVTCCLRGQDAGDSIPHLGWWRYFADFCGPGSKSSFPLFHQPRKATVSRRALYGGCPLGAFEHAQRKLGRE